METQVDTGVRRHVLQGKIVSAGQTGAVLGALLAARELGIETGGVAPKGCLTENGPQEVLLRSFGLSECEEDGYPEITRISGKPIKRYSPLF